MFKLCLIVWKLLDGANQTVPHFSYIFVVNNQLFEKNYTKPGVNRRFSVSQAYLVMTNANTSLHSLRNG